jgi:hypothetical protein
VPAASKAAPNLRTPVYTSFSSYLVMKDLSEVCSLSCRVMLFYRSVQLSFPFVTISYVIPFRNSTRIRTITARHSLFPRSSTRTPISSPYGSPSQREEIRAYHVPHKYLTSDLGSTHRPTAQHLCQETRQPLILAAHHFGSGLISAPLACLN